MSLVGTDLRTRILERATALFLEEGYRGLSMRAIAESVGVSKAALYYHFRDKEELFLAILEIYLDSMADDIQEVLLLPLPARQKIELLVERILSRPAEQRAVIRLSSQEITHLSPEVRKAFERSYHDKFILGIQAIIQEGCDTGELKTFDPSFSTWALLGMMYPYFYPAHLNELPPASQISHQLAAIFLDGLSLPAANAGEHASKR
jgi:AcrR family transcriptional regulator